MESDKGKKARLARHDKIVARAEELIRKIAPTITAEFDLSEDEGVFYTEFGCARIIGPHPLRPSR